MSAVSKDDTLQRLAAFNAQLVAEAQQANDAALWRQFAEINPDTAARFADYAARAAAKEQ